MYYIFNTYGSLKYYTPNKHWAVALYKKYRGIPIMADSLEEAKEIFNTSLTPNDIEF